MRVNSTFAVAALVALTAALGATVPGGAAAATTYRQLTAGDGYTCGLTKAGRVVCRGYDAYGQTRVPAGKSG